MSKQTDHHQKTFSLHWGYGVVEEEAQFATRYHMPTVQLLKFTGGQAAGSRAIRFCHYDARGRFQRSSLIIDQKDLNALAHALKRAPKLRKLLAALA